MPFLTADNTNILMDLNEIGECPPVPGWAPMEQHALKVEDMRRFKDAGATVALEFLPWSKVNPGADVWDWAYADEMIDRCHNAGLKVLFMGPCDVPQWMPDDWYVWLGDGTPLRKPDARNPMHTYGLLSPWNPDSANAQLEFITRMCERYNSNEVLCIYGNSNCGESMLPEASPALYDPAAIKSFQALVHKNDVRPNVYDLETQYWMCSSMREWMLGQQQIFLTHPSRELFLSLAPYYQLFSASANANVAGYIDAIVNRLHPAQMSYISFTYFQITYELPYCQWFKHMSTLYGVKFVVGSEWLSGAVENAPKARDQGLRLLTGIIHPFTHHYTVEDDMVEQMRQSHAIMVGEAIPA